MVRTGFPLPRNDHSSGKNSLFDAGHRRDDVLTNSSELTSSAWIYAEPTRAGRRRAAKTRGCQKTGRRQPGLLLVI